MFTVRKRFIGLAAIAFSQLWGCAASEPADSLQFENAPHAIAATAVGSPQFFFGSGRDIEMIVPVADHGTTRLEAFTSRSDGGEFTDLGPISVPGTGINAYGENAPRFAMDHDELLYAVWREESPDEKLLISVHDWRTRRWSTPIPVRDANARGYAGFPSIAVGADNTIYVVWLDERNSQGDASSVYYSTMRNGRVSRNALVATSTCGCCRPAVTVAPDGTVYVAWRNDLHDMRDIAVASMRPGQRSFSPLRIVAHDGWKLHGCPESGPSLLADGKRLYVSWYTQGFDARSRVRLAYSDDGAQTFSAPLDVSQSTLDANHPDLVAMKPNGVAVVFQARDAQAAAGWSHLVPYIARLRPDGDITQPVAIVTPEARDATDPYAVAPDAQSIFVGYTLGTRAVILRGRML